MHISTQKIHSTPSIILVLLALIVASMPLSEAQAADPGQIPIAQESDSSARNKRPKDIEKWPVGNPFAKVASQNADKSKTQDTEASDQKTGSALFFDSAPIL
ncbi:MAG: hypothetical protein L0220_23970, partial [Acidobacteria bacterium]|nr:hypothetical protein [Acidobacteriota bacterium]